MLIFAFTVLNPIDEVLQKKQKIVNSYDKDFDEALHFNMGNFVYEYQQQHYGENSLTDDIYEKIIETEGVGLVFQSGTETINYNTNKTDDAGNAVYSNALSFMYNDEMAHNVNFKLKSGKISYDVDGGIPILVSEILERELPVGTQTEVFDMDGKAVKCVVTGVLKKNEALPLINSYGSSESLGTLGVIPENSGCNRYMVMYDLKKDMDFEVDLGAKFIVLPESGYDRQKLKEGLEESVGDWICRSDRFDTEKFIYEYVEGKCQIYNCICHDCCDCSIWVWWLYVSYDCSAPKGIWYFLYPWNVKKENDISHIFLRTAFACYSIFDYILFNKCGYGKGIWSI